MHINNVPNSLKKLPLINLVLHLYLNKEKYASCLCRSLCQQAS